MPAILANRDCSIADAVHYQRHRPEQTLLYQIVERHYPAFLAELISQGRTMPDYVQREFDDFLKCGCLEHGFLRIRCETSHAEKLVAFSCKRRGFCPSGGAKRMVESAALLVDDVLPIWARTLPSYANVCMRRWGCPSVPARRKPLRWQLSVRYTRRWRRRLCRINELVRQWGLHSAATHKPRGPSCIKIVYLHSSLFLDLSKYWAMACEVLVTLA